jgi:ferric-dicitrate binding protein FerR (iron transport regulator)
MKAETTRTPLLLALGSLRDVPAAVAPAEDEAARRARIAAHVLLTAQAEDRRETIARRRQGTWSWVLAAVSLASVVALGIQSSVYTPPRALVLAGQGIAPAVLGSSLRALASQAQPFAIWTPQVPVIDVGFELLSGNLTTPNAEASDATWTATEPSLLRLEGDAEVELASETEVRLASGPGRGDGALEVLRGRVAVRHAGARGLPVRIKTESVLIDGSGARFSVSYVARGTTVDVVSGSVRVEREQDSHRVRAGESWQDRARSGDAEAEVAPLDQAPLVDQAPTAGVGPEQTSDTLAEQNRLFRSAMLAKQRGLDSLALQRLDDLLARHPQTVLAESARVERLRILARSGAEDRARAAARAYLSAHPRGFANQVAVRVLGTGE